MKRFFTIVTLMLLIGVSTHAQTWTPVSNSGTSFILYGMSFPPNQNDVGFACGMKYTWDADGVIVKTTDGGNTWAKIWPASGTIDGLEGIWFINDQLGFAAGWNNYFIKTTNGGTTWTPVSCGTNVLYYVDVVFWDDLNGVAAAAIDGGGQSVFITNDGGNTWVPATSGTAVNIGRICYADQKTLFAVGIAGKVYKSADGGHNWTVKANLGGTLVGVDFANSSFGVVGAEEHIYTTQDGGETWTNYSTGYEFFFGCKAFEDGTAYLAGDDNIYFTDDFGQSYTPDYLGAFGAATFYRIRSTPNGNLFVSGSGGTILKKTMPVTAAFSAEPTLICMNESVTFTDLSMGGVTSWNWTFEGGNPATSTEQNPVVVYNTPGVYDVSLKVGDGTTTNTQTVTDMITVDDCTGIPQNASPVFGIYPNPGADALNIKLSVTKGENYSVIVSNLLGQTVSSLKGKGSGMEEVVRVNLNDIPEGHYVIGVTTVSGGTSYSKYIIAR